MKKGLIKNIFPDYKFISIADVNINLFLKSELIIFDVDNTLVFSETTETKKEVIDWFLKIKKQYKCVCVSNSMTIAERKEKIENSLQCDIFLSQRKKPSKRLFGEVLNKYNIKSGKIFVVGDKIFPDILFGNRNRAITILVHPLISEKDILAKIEREIEHFILWISDFLGYN